MRFCAAHVQLLYAVVWCGVLFLSACVVAYPVGNVGTCKVGARES